MVHLVDAFDRSSSSLREKYGADDFARSFVSFTCTSGAPYFTGKNVSEFLKTWENLCEDYGVSSADQLRKLPRYCTRLIGRYIETISEYQAKEWDGLKTILLQEYRQEDVDQQMETLSFLEAFKNQKRSDGDDMRQYCRRFAAVSKLLVQRGELSRYEQVKWFVQGMPEKMAELSALPGWTRNKPDARGTPRTALATPRAA